ncbi:Outer membrane efflux protein [Pseudomonas chlororaphis subsp. aurantiaca]|nr:Outer membrane efflux protein [Pseudomonas chlororaphis subsp. aurantiaca]AZD91388.1 Outer membrane efflux protein [Pseudomonas chlororaphis subsp. aureofaciens]QHC88572.1 hypothetical protein PchlR47_09620 [Pseudomonas chlororaphis]AZD41064.1 Outer membrane efflux protein [Pseudomonas chlororaphis subsp. aurantiaca]AZD47346.1 Outer membrane efflux protein [Pseudomonas chlororaphis subsp. aurantiaca]
MKNPIVKFVKATAFSTVLIGLYACGGHVALAAESEANPGSLNQRQMADLAERFSGSQKNTAVDTQAPVVPTQSGKSLSPAMASQVGKPENVSTEPVLPGPSLRTLIQNGERPASNELRSLLRGFVGKALQHSPEVRVANANESAAGYEIDEVKGRRWPQVRLGMNSALTKEERRSGRSASGETTGTVNVTTNVWDWGKNASEIRTAQAAQGSAEQTGLIEREQVAFDTSSELINLMRYEQSMVVAEDYVQQMNSRVDMLLKIIQSDKGRTSELVQARAKLLSALASRKQIENQQQLTRIKLHRLLGEEVLGIPERFATDNSLMVQTSAALAALDKHPLLLRLKAQAEIEDGRAGALRAQGLPGLNLVARKEQGGLYGSNANSNRSNDWYVGFDVQWQAFSGGSNKAARGAANARKSAAMEQYEKVGQDLRQEIKRLAQSRATSAQLAQEYQRLSVETDQVRKMFYEQWYSLGKRTLLDVLVAESDHFNSQLQAINNTYDSMIADLSILSSSALLLGYLSL